MDVNIFGQVRGLARSFFSSAQQDVQPVLADGGEQIIAQGLPELTELVRLGGSWHVLGAVTAALTAVPTTTAGHSLWNGEAQGGKSYAIDSFGCVEVVIDATQANSLALFAMNNKGLIAAPTDAALAVGSMSGKKYGGFALTVAGATVVNDVWTPHGPAAPAGGSALAGDVWRVTEYQARGLYLVRPGGMFSVAAAKVAATASQIRYFIRWHEVQVSLG